MNDPAPISLDSFPNFFEAVWGYEPFPWQTEFAQRIAEGKPPDYVAVPTGSGKTACLDAAIFALAAQASRPPSDRTIGRRIFFVVNRRIIVDEAYERAALHLRPALRDPGEYLKNRESKKPKEQRKTDSELATHFTILEQVAGWLKTLACDIDADPLVCAELRGGICRDRAWAKSLVQPMIICSTVDQIGSRLLFRGYGVSPEARPIHAALVSQDSFLVIDEAHISRPFLETLGWVKRYRTFRPPGAKTVALPFSAVSLTATPPGKISSGTILDLSGRDLEHPVLKARLSAKKPVQLVPAPRAKGKGWNEELANVLVTHATAIIEKHSPRSIAIMVNRVATARTVNDLIRKAHPSAEVTLLLGRMRPLDRDVATRRLCELLKTQTATEAAEQFPLQIVVSTQCLEVGADLDFDALVTECASLDALRQRFGRLNRAGRPIEAQAVVVLPEEQNIPISKLNDSEPIDLIYGNAIPRTWAWLRDWPDGADFGIEAMTFAVSELRATESGEAQFHTLLSPSGKAPVLLPAYLDCWAQTNPRPAADPDVAIFLHGPDQQMEEVQVCWRADLPKDANEIAWSETLALCPPTILECLPVPLRIMRQWLEAGGRSSGADTSGDAPERVQEAGKIQRPSVQTPPVLVWRGAKSHAPFGEDTSRLVRDPRLIRPGDTLVLRIEDGGWQNLGHVPEVSDTASLDCAEIGQALLRRRAFVRIHPAVWPKAEQGSPVWQLAEWTRYPDFEWRTASVSSMLEKAADSLDEPSNDTTSLASRLLHLARWTERKRGGSGLQVESAPGYDGLVLSVKEPIPKSSEMSQRFPDEDEDDLLLEAPAFQTISQHTSQVESLVRSYSSSLGLEEFEIALAEAAKFHDTGKADPRFQALLIGGDVASALARTVTLAKSASIPTSATLWHRARLRAELPERFRHEMLSVLMAERTIPHEENDFRTLVLHLIAAHHGHSRPSAPIVDDENPPDVDIDVDGKKVKVESEYRREHPAHAWDSGIVERFWLTNRRYGWWGVVLLESVLRLADQFASANPKPVSMS